MPNGVHISLADCAEMRRRYRDGDETQEAIADDVGTSGPTIRNHLYGRCGHDDFVDEPALPEPDAPGRSANGGPNRPYDETKEFELLTVLPPADGDEWKQSADVPDDVSGYIPATLVSLYSKEFVERRPARGPGGCRYEYRRTPAGDRVVETGGAHL